MAISIYTNSEETIDLEEFNEYHEKYIDNNDADSILMLAEPLRRLANNKKLGIEFLSRYLLKPDEQDSINKYSSKSFILDVREKYVLRLNIWMKSKLFLGTTKWEDNIYSYEFAHNHNFNLLTVGYWGSGYWTEIYDFDPTSVIGDINEKVDLRFLEKTSLPEGKVILYRRQRDVHSQLPPEDFSISLNFMPLDAETWKTEQYAFDLKRSCISKVLESQVFHKNSLLQIAAAMGQPDFLDPLSKIAISSSNRRSRISALYSMSKIAPSNSESIWKIGLSDKDSLVRKISSRRLDEM